MFLLSTVLFISCEQDDVVVVEEEQHTPAVFITKMIHSKQSLPHTIKDVLSKTKHCMGIADSKKSTYDSINGFWIDDSRSFYLNSGEYDSYTFPIIHNDSTKLKNLLFSKEKNGTYTSFIVTYDLNYISLNDIHSGISTSLLQHITYDSVTSDFQFKDASFSVVGSGDCISEIKIDGRPCSECGTPYGQTGCNLEPGDPRRAIGDRVLIIKEDCEEATGGTGVITEPVDDPNDDPNNGNTNDPNDPYISGSGTNNGNNDSNNNANQADLIDDDTEEQDECLKLSNNDCSSVITSPIDPKPFVKPVDQETQNFFDGLGTPLKDHINNADQNELRQKVNEFLIEENHDQPAKDFAEEAIKAKEESENNEVDFENKSIYDPSVPECLKTIIDKFKPTNEGISIDMNGVDQAILNQLNVPGDIMQLFDNNENYGLKFKMEVIDDQPNGSRTNAITHTEINPNGSKMAVITFNTNYVDTATDLALARTAIHELLHAYMNYATRNRDPNTTIAQMIDLVLGQTFAPPSSLQHEVMARQLIGAMAGSLAQWDNYQQAPIEYTRLAWSGGMRDSDVFENLDLMEQDAINARDQIESGDPRNTLPVIPLGSKSC